MVDRWTRASAEAVRSLPHGTTSYFWTIARIFTTTTVCIGSGQIICKGHRTQHDGSLRTSKETLEQWVKCLMYVFMMIRAIQAVDRLCGPCNQSSLPPRQTKLLWMSRWVAASWLMARWSLLNRRPSLMPVRESLAVRGTCF